MRIGTPCDLCHAIASGKQRSGYGKTEAWNVEFPFRTLCRDLHSPMSPRVEAVPVLPTGVRIRRPAKWFRKKGQAIPDGRFGSTDPGPEL